jgi:hypothetical protein
MKRNSAICLLLAFGMLAMLIPVGNVNAVPIVITEDLPTSQGGMGERITAKTLFFNEYEGDKYFIDTTVANYTGMNFSLPWPSSAGITVLSDKLWINDIQQIDVWSVMLYLMVSSGMTEQQAFDFMTAAIGLPAGYSFDINRYWTLSTVLLSMWKVQASDYITNGTFNVSSFPSYLLDFKMNGSAFIDLKSIHAQNISVFSYGRINCSREVIWTQDVAFNWLYYTSQRKYQATLSLNNSMSYCDWYDVQWYVGFPENRTVDLTTLNVQDLDNAMRLSLGVNYDTSGAGVNMQFADLVALKQRTFTFTIYSYNATAGLGIAIGYASGYNGSSYNGASYFKATPSWTNDYGRLYQGQMQLKLDFADGNARYIEPSSVIVYDKVGGRYLSPWEFSIASGLIFVDFVQVPVGNVQSFDVYFHLDMSSTTQDSISLWDNIPGSPIPIWAVLLVAAALLGGLVLIGPKKGDWKKYRGTAAILLAVLACIAFLMYYFNSAGVL